MPWGFATLGVIEFPCGSVLQVETLLHVVFFAMFQPLSGARKS